ncbi:hypothetical protein PIB30_093061 [Stylosanthes scabra]|uniref:Uncharacterized protein n=1 Tax=Stylosanthes scabra TaxID=79078 RepID=A0ABU6TWF0_9FABA|nr:hypothetical protein [Stylosanthes scabra]
MKNPPCYTWDESCTTWGLEWPLDATNPYDSLALRQVHRIKKLGLGVVSGESPRLGVSAGPPRLVHSRLGVGAGRLGVARSDAASLSCCLATPRRCHGRLRVGAEIPCCARA